MIEGDFRPWQILRVLGLDAGEQRHALKIIRKFGELFADGSDGLERPV